MAREMGVRELLARAAELPEGDERYDLVARAVRQADTHQDERTAFEARMQLSQAATFAGRQEEMLVAVTWLLSRYDARPGDYAGFKHDLFWQLKYLVDNVGDFPTIPLAQIRALYDQVESRFRDAGYSLRPYFSCRYYAAASLGDQAEAERYYRAWQNAKRDRLANCAACELDVKVAFRRNSGDHVRALDLAAPILEGRLRCATVPIRTCAGLLKSFVIAGRMPDAREWDRRNYRLFRSGRQHVDYAGDHIVFRGFSGDYAGALRIFERYARLALEFRPCWTSMQFYNAAARLFDLLARRRGAIKLKLPPRHPLCVPAGEYATAALYEWFESQAASIAAQFDARNGNDHVSTAWRRSAAWLDLEPAGG